MEPSSSSSPSPLKEEDIPRIPLSSAKLKDTTDGDETPKATEETTASVVQSHTHDARHAEPQTGENEEEDNDDEDEDEEEPKLKYVRLTSTMGNVYRNGDATSTAIVIGDKLVLPLFLSSSTSFRDCPFADV
ncbi:hypothetical protein ABW19_dt0200331 [Dactylella cylindrospora]|nr:hypothetical protein ABW19_dt0200331 [Dactylella cylindrospora]